MAQVDARVWHRSLLVSAVLLSMLLTLVFGCPTTENSPPDALVARDAGGPSDRPEAGMPDAAEDAAVVGWPDAAHDAGAPDAGPADVGPCGCTFGFHHDCPQGDVCTLGHSEAPLCTRTAPWSGAHLGCTLLPRSDANPWLCNAQCASVERGSACGAIFAPRLSSRAEDWYRKMDDAAQRRQGHEPRLSAAEVDDLMRSIGDPECDELLGWTMIGVYAFCRGPASINVPINANGIEDIEFAYIGDDDCLQAAGICVSMFLGTIVFPGRTLDGIEAHCPNGLPFAAPCDGSDAIACAEARITEWARFLTTSPPE